MSVETQVVVVGQWLGLLLGLRLMCGCILFPATTCTRTPAHNGGMCTSYDRRDDMDRQLDHFEFNFQFIQCAVNTKMCLIIV